MVRPTLQFALLAAVILAVESAVLQHPVAVLLDMTVFLPAMWWLIVVRRGAARPRSTVRIAVLALALCGAAFGWNLKLFTAPLELLLVAFAVAASRRGGLRKLCVALFGDTAAARAVETELTVLRYALWPPRSDGGFTAHRRAGWAAIAAALAIASVGEGLAVHFLLHGAAQWISLGLHAYAVLWLVGDARALAARSTHLDGDILRVRLGLRWEADVPRAKIVSIAHEVPAGALRLAVIGKPNVAVTLDEPVEVRGLFGVTKRASVLGLQLDEPERFAQALRA